MLVACVPGMALVHTSTGDVEGTVSADARIQIFRGIPYAAPPVGTLRWKPPLPAPQWKGVLKATQFGPRCMQVHLYDDMFFRDNGPSEDCLTLNVWTPTLSSGTRLPVMFWVHGGGDAGGSSEPRQDGEKLAEKGVVVVSCNYRLGVFGFLALPDLAKESEHHASGNYGLLDQVAALQWVRENIAAFGGDPGNVTIFGESAGAFSVSGLMASPLAQGLFERAIGESGAMFGDMYSLLPLVQSEERGQKFADSLGRHTLKQMRAMPADELLQAATKQPEDRFWRPNIDGYFLTEDTRSIYASGKQSHVPLLAGWNADEVGYDALLEKEEPTVQNYTARLHALFQGGAESYLKYYPAGTNADAKQSAHDLASDQFISYATWKWIDMHAATGDSPVFRYQFDDALPQPASVPSRGAYHSAEIEFVFDVLASKNLPWRPGDQKVSDLMSAYWTNFAKRADPNGPGLPTWPAYGRQTNYQVMHLCTNPYPRPEEHRARYEFLDSLPHNHAASGPGTN